MTSRLVQWCIAADDPGAMMRFWAGLLGWSVVAPREDRVITPPDDTGFDLRFVPATEPKTGPNRVHPDLTSGSRADQELTVARALDLGARTIDIGQRPEEGHVVLADPEGNEFCVIGPGNRFLADCGFVGALACDGTQGVGYFWSRALDWPLVWDQDEETAIRSPHGGPKISWGGPPVAPKVWRNRWHPHLEAVDVEDEVERLLGLGARHDDTQMYVDGVPFLDPDGNEFCLLTARPSR